MQTGAAAEEFRRLKKSAEERDGAACSLLGLLYVKGSVTVNGTVIRRRPSDEQAIRYLRDAANLGNYDHAFYLANAYFGGIDVTPDFPRALRLYELCAMTHSASAAQSRAAFVRYADPETLSPDSLRHYRICQLELEDGGAQHFP
ncbi:MAG: sel1 repeat family protein [Clostridia bacterium]|nr:sel1 repeat family protein [Clostridia bacterium]